MGISSLIRINASPHPDGWLFTLSDNRPGLMEPAELENLFRPFVHGLYLATCREIEERHGGKIWAESRADEFQFLFTLPK
jgi:signal transduction histidine kinase